MGSGGVSGVRRRGWRILLPAVTAGAVLTAGCGALGLDTTGPVDATLQTSAAPVASGSDDADDAVRAPVLQTGTTSSRPAPTPWQSLLSTSAPTTTSSEFTLTAPTTTRTTLSFETLASVTAPTVAAPTRMGSPPPKCYTQGSCTAVSSASASGGTVEVLNSSGSSSTVVVLTAQGHDATSVSLARLSSPAVACSGAYCLVQGTKSGLHFGTLLRASGGVLKSLSGTASSIAALELHGSGSSLVVAGMHRFDDYGVGPSDSPTAARTWAASGGRLVSTGCGAPHLYSHPPAATRAQHGACSGTPKIAGYGSASAHKLVSLRGLGFVTPSGNIKCALIDGKVLCTAKQTSFKVKKCGKKNTPTGLRVILGKTGSMKHDGCIGFTLPDSSQAARIGYHRMAVGDGFSCVVRQSGVTCEAPSGHGFSLARAALQKR